MTALTKDFRSVADDTDDDEAPQTRSDVRDANQIEIDKDAAALHTAWQATPEPHPTHADLTTKDGFKASDKRVYVVTKEDRGAVRAMIRRACLLADKGVPVFLKDKLLDSGEYRVKWTWAPKPPKAETPAVTPADAENPGEPENDETKRRRFGVNR